ncbi:MAG: SAM-dependent methyltransferase [Bacteroides sp.]|uniref:THUMP-like domain-containing protein n=1 Tax=Bacteroides sp. TaxID=29523 RepID=UPI002FC8BFC7
MMNISSATLDFIRTHSDDDVRTLALQAKKYPQVNMELAIRQIAGRKVLADKVPSWSVVEGLLYPRHLSLEQCSSEATASYKAALAAGDSFTDLTGGFGIDCAFLAKKFTKAVYVERQEELCTLASHNFPLLSLNHIEVHNDDGVAYLWRMQPVDMIFIDPARRNEQGGKTVAISDCEPDVAALAPVLTNKAGRVMIKLSPMLDLTLALRDMPYAYEAHILSVNNECKELLLMAAKQPVREVTIHCVNLTAKGAQTFSFTREAEQAAHCTYAEQPETYLYEPNASILKAGAFRKIASIYKLKKLHPNSHLYTSNEWIEDFPGRSFRITATGSLNKKEIKELMQGATKANITVRNFPATVAELRKRTKLSDGGDIYLFATTLANEQKVLIRGEKL